MNDQIMQVQFRGKDIKSMDGKFSKSDPFLQIYAMDPQPRMVTKTEYIKNTKEPVWKPLQVSLTQLCQNDMNRPIKISCLDFDDHSAADLIGSFETSVSQLKQGTGFEQELHPPKASRKSVGRIGTIGAARVAVKESFEGLLYRGMEISLVVAVDWTASNQAPNKPTSLHYLDPSGKLNAYQEALSTVGGILLSYDRDQYVPLYGFGGKLPGQTSTSQCFPLSGQQDPRVVGVQGMMQAYQAALQNVALSGPTQFGPVLAEAIRSARSGGDALKYTVLLILTDGMIMDMNKVKEQIKSSCTNTPLSIVIVGVGNADFAGMEELDGDHSRSAFPRDIVQFVEFRAYAGRPHATAALASEVLAEIPGQCESYFFNKNLR